MARKGQLRLRRLDAEVARRYPRQLDPHDAITSGRVSVNGRVVTNPASMVELGWSIVIREPTALRGELKLRAALTTFDVDVRGRVALDLGAAAGGFTRALLVAGARRVYAVDTGHGQLLGSLRQDERVVNLERTNVSALDRELVPDVIDVVTVDLSYLAVSQAVRQLRAIHFAGDAVAIVLVKPMFELGRSSAPLDDDLVREAVARAEAGLQVAGWKPLASIDSPLRGQGGAREALVHARRALTTREP